MKAKRILIVDDDSTVSRILVRVFERAGHNVTAASNGRRALTRLEQEEERFDAMVSDIQMPEMTGRELCLHLASQGPYLPDCVIIVTSRSEDEERNWVKECPGVSLLEKPVSPKEILKVVTTRLQELAAESDRRAA